MDVQIFHGAFALILAFQLLSCRAWLGSLMSCFFVENSTNLHVSASLISIPLAYFLGKYLGPPIAKLQAEPKMMLMVALIPITYYIVGMMRYLFDFYSLDSVENLTHLINYIDAWFILIFLIYTLVSLHVFEEKKGLDVERAVLLRMHDHAVVELKQLHRQSEIERMHKHDLRHHGNYLLSLLPENIDSKVIEYIDSVLISPERSEVLLSNNESLNLLLNFYKKKSESLEIPLDIQIAVEVYADISMIDLCNLLSNGLENAVNACKNVEKSQRRISLKLKTTGQTLSIDLRNTFSEMPHFVHDMPVSSEAQHGYGTKSMLRICEKYSGITRFDVIDQEFRFQTILRNQIGNHYNL